MSDVNTQVKSLLLDTQLIVSNKFTVFGLDDGVDKAKLKALQQKADDEITRFHAPEIWLRPIPLDQPKVFACLLEINKVAVPKIDDLTTQIDTLIGVLNAALDATALPVDTTRTFNASVNSNQEALDALLKAGQASDDRLVFFGRQGIDLGSDPDFIKLDDRQLPLRTEYRRRLRDQSVSADEIDVMILKNFAGFFLASDTLPVYFGHYGKLSDFIEERIPTV